MSNKVLIPEKDLDDETIKRFLVGIMLTDEWADEFNPVHIAITFAHETNVYTPHISTYLHGIKKLLETKELKASDRLYKKGTSMSVGDAIVWSLIENELARRKQ